MKEELKWSDLKEQEPAERYIWSSIEKDDHILPYLDGTIKDHIGKIFEGGVVIRLPWMTRLRIFKHNKLTRLIDKYSYPFPITDETIKCEIGFQYWLIRKYHIFVRNLVSQREKKIFIGDSYNDGLEEQVKEHVIMTGGRLKSKDPRAYWWIFSPISPKILSFRFTERGLEAIVYRLRKLNPQFNSSGMMYTNPIKYVIPREEFPK